MAVSSYGVPGSSITSITCCCRRSLPPPPPSSTTDLRRRAVLFTIASSTFSSFHHHQHLPLPPTTSLPPLPAFANEEEKEDELQKEEDIAVSVFEKASPSVVAVQNVEILEQKSVPNSRIGDENTTVNGTGSGFVWDKWGHIVTNYHVVAKLATDTSGLQHCKIVLMDSATSATLVKEADLVGCDAAHDLAVLKISVEGLTLKPASLGTSHDLRVGQSCFAIGNPYGYERTLTTGVVSGLGRQIPSPSGNSIKGAIQTDAAINSGNSGGPLIDSYGHVVGVNTATFTRKGTGTSSGVNFAIPIDTVSKIVPYLIVYGTDLKDRY